MEKEKHYHSTVFKPEVITEALHVFENFAMACQKEGILKLSDSVSLKITRGVESWQYNNKDEFFADYRKNPDVASFNRHLGLYYFRLFLDFDSYTIVTVSGESRSAIESVFEIFEKYASQSKVPDKRLSVKAVKVFIGHGSSPHWRDIKDHLQDKHNYNIEAYEIGARAGHGIRDILEDMLNKSSFAILVMTGEDRDENGNLHARENVIHELGLFQGRLGFSKAIVLLEDGTVEFSNIHGIHQIRYSKGNIKETYGEVLATLHREFPR